MMITLIRHVSGPGQAPQPTYAFLLGPSLLVEATRPMLSAR
ncbi:MAG: hypothetical protein ACR2JP_01830 [Acidimicrobiia bacterium]